MVDEESREDFSDVLTSIFEVPAVCTHTVVPGGAPQRHCIAARLMLCAVVVSRGDVGVGAVGADVAHCVLTSCTCALHSLPGRTLAVADAHVVVLIVVVARFALALAVAVGRARRLYHHVVAADSTSQAFTDVVPQGGEGTGRTRFALALVRRGAA